MNDEQMKKFLALARQGRPAPSTDAPSGFAARVAARWCAQKKPSAIGDLWERACWWASGLALAVCVLTASLQSPAEPENPFDLLIEMPASSTVDF